MTNNNDCQHVLNTLVAQALRVGQSIEASNAELLKAHHLPAGFRRYAHDLLEAACLLNATPLLAAASLWDTETLCLLQSQALQQDRNKRNEAVLIACRRIMSHVRLNTHQQKHAAAPRLQSTTPHLQEVLKALGPPHPIDLDSPALSNLATTMFPVPPLDLMLIALPPNKLSELFEAASSSTKSWLTDEVISLTKVLQPWSAQPLVWTHWASFARQRFHRCLTPCLERLDALSTAQQLQAHLIDIAPPSRSPSRM